MQTVLTSLNHSGAWFNHFGNSKNDRLMLFKHENHRQSCDFNLQWNLNNHLNTFYGIAIIKSVIQFLILKASIVQLCKVNDTDSVLNILNYMCNGYCNIYNYVCIVMWWIEINYHQKLIFVYFAIHR